MRLKFILILILIGISYTLFAQTNKYQFSNLDISNGLSHNQVNCIYKDARGFMWFGTMSGLNRYDGYTFKIFRHNSKDKNSLTDDYIQNIFGGPGQTLWLATRSGLCVYDPKKEQFSSDIKTWLKTLNLPDYAGIAKIKKDSRGNFWIICTNVGIYCYNPASKQTRFYNTGNYAHPSLNNSTVVDLAEDTAGNIWFVYNDGVVEKLDWSLDKITFRSSILNKESNGKLQIYSMMIDRDNDLWLYPLGVNVGVYYINPATLFLTIMAQTALSRYIPT